MAVIISLRTKFDCLLFSHSPNLKPQSLELREKGALTYGFVIDLVVMHDGTCSSFSAVVASRVLDFQVARGTYARASVRCTSVLDHRQLLSWDACLPPPPAGFSGTTSERPPGYEEDSISEFLKVAALHCQEQLHSQVETYASCVSMYLHVYMSIQSYL